HRKIRYYKSDRGSGAAVGLGRKKEMNGSSETQEARDLIAGCSEWAEAMLSNDADRIGAFMADEWVIVSERGVAGKEHFLEFVRSGRLTHSKVELVGEPRVHLQGV